MTVTAFCINQQFETLAKSEGKKARFRGVALSGKLIPNRMHDGSALSIDVASFNLSEEGKKIFILADHDHRQRIGTAIARKIGGQILLEDGEFFSTDEGQKIETQMSEGGPFELSVGISGRTVFYEQGKRKNRQLDGKKHDIGAEVFDAELMETSFVVAGADRNTSVQRFAKSVGAECLENHKFTDLFTGDTSMDAEKLTIELAASTASLAQANIALTAKTAEAVELSTKLAATEKELSDMKEKQAQDKAAARLSAITEKFGATLSKDETELLAGMTDAQFAFAAKSAQAKPAESHNFNRTLVGAESAKVSSLHAFAIQTGKIAAAK